MAPFSLTQPPQFDSIFVSFPPLLRLAYNQMHRELEYLVHCLRLETQTSLKQQKQQAAYDLLFQMRKLCVDPKLLKYDIINPSPTNALFESIHNVAPNVFVSEAKFCAKCGNEDDVLATSCFHFLCIGCMSYLYMMLNDGLNDGRTKKLSCYVCNMKMEPKDIWLPYDTRSKVDFMVTLLKEEYPNHKVIVFCEFVETLVRLEFAPRLNNMKALCYFDNMNGTIQNRDDANIFLFDLKLLDDLEGFDLSCVSKVYFMNACPETTEQEVASLVAAKQKNEVKFVRLLTKCTIEGRMIEVEKFDGVQNIIDIFDQVLNIRL